MKKVKKTLEIILTVFAFIAVVFLTAADSFGMSAAVSTSADLTMAKRQALEQKRNLEKSYSRSKTIAVYALYLPYLAELENTVPYFENCGVITNPKVFNDFVGGVNTSIGIDVYAMDYINKTAELGSKNKLLRQKKIKKYMLCVASYGLILAQAFKNFGNGLSGGAYMSGKTYGITTNSFYNLVGSSLYSAITHQDGRLKAEFKNIKREINDNTCVMVGKSFKCGGVYMSIESSPKMSWGGLDWFNPQADFAGNNDVITIGYNKSRSFGQTQTKDRAINWADNNANNIASDLINGLF